VTAADAAALKFKPLSAEELKDLEPPSNDEWIRHLAMLRLTWIALGKTKDELKEIVSKSEADGLGLIERFTGSVEFLKACADFMGMAEMRLLSAGAALALEDETATAGGRA
jgi:hypothetical protein